VKYLDEFRDPDTAKRLLAALDEETTRPWTIMEVCGGQTHTIARYGLEELVPDAISLVHGPGCPVCVTPLEVLERARRLALTPGVTLHTFGDMLRVPGVNGDLLDARSRGAQVHVVLSPLDAVDAARRDPDRTHVLFAVGFETTAPTTAMAVELARRLGLDNFCVLASHVRVPPAIEAILSNPEQRVQGFLAAGHVCTVEGTEAYPPLAARFCVPIVVTGFEPVDLLSGLLACVRELEAGRHGVLNAYPRAVRPEGNPSARAQIDAVFEVVDRPWRGLGVIARGGLALRPELAPFDAERRFPLALGPMPEPAACQAGRVLQGLLAPVDCPEFGKGCRPEHPLGAPMVSSEGACAAYHRFGRGRAETA
jgi:hydrogenase expression/formation protein HypD